MLPATRWIGVLLMLGFAIASFRYAWQLRGRLPRPSLRALARTLHKQRKARKLPPWLELLHVVGWAFAFLSIAVVVSGYPTAGRWIMMPVLVVFFLAGMVDLTIRIKYVVRHVWSGMLGKVFAVSFGAALALAALALAKHIVHDITHIDPKYLLESTGALAALLLPVVYCMFGICALVLIFVFQMIAVGIFMTVSLLVGYWRPLLGASRGERLRLLYYRITHGKRPPGGKLPKRKLFQVDDLSMFARPVCTAAVIAVVGGLLAEFANAASGLRQTVEYAIVGMEYRSATSCLNLPKDSLVAYMEDGNVSVASGDARKRRFEVQKCALTKADDGERASSAGL